MLIEFTLGNYLSFQEKETFSLVATDLKGNQENIMEIEDGFSLLKTAGIYGANASGKSNILHAINFVGRFIINSFKNTQEGDSIGVLPFKLDEVSDKNPSFFEIVFLMNDQLVKFGFEATMEKVCREWLYIDEEEIYFRTEQTYTSQVFSNDSSIEVKWEMTRDNVLFLSVLASTNTDFAKKIVNYFNVKVNVISGLHLKHARYSKKLLKEQDLLADDMVAFLKQLDVNIQGLEIEQRRYNILDTEGVDIPESVKNMIELDEMEIMTKHNVYNQIGEIVSHLHFPASELESNGTNQLIALSGPIAHTLENGGVLLIDEMDAQLHPLLSKSIIQLFNSRETNKKNAQLIITTHNIANLSHDLFRRDQIWFVEKDLKERSHLVSLVEYQLETNQYTAAQDYSEDYLKGKYGAIPILSHEIRVLEAERLE